MYIPIVKKLTQNNNVLIERALPKKGQIDSPLGAKIEPFTKLGVTKVSYGNLPLNKKIRIAKNKNVGTYFYTGDTIGRVGRKKIIAPFDGLLGKTPAGGYFYKQDERDFWLLAGVWGEVVDFVDEHSVLIKTQTYDLHLAACTQTSFAGELVVFPNPSELLEMQYLNQYSKDSFGKVIYMGDYIDEEIVERAAELGVSGLLAGSCSRGSFTLAKKYEIFLGSISGFGHIPTPSYIFDILKNISSRYVFLQGSRGLVRIPAPALFSEKEVTPSGYSGQLRKLKKGLLVQVLEEPYFGLIGNIDSVQEDNIHVILDEVDGPVKIRIQNLLALE